MYQWDEFKKDESKDESDESSDKETSLEPPKMSLKEGLGVLGKQLNWSTL